MYEVAIQGYQFQVTRYNTWMNYYALFVGALFVGLYYMVAFEKLAPRYCIINWLIIGLGILASICWMASLIGFDSWIKNWLLIVKEQERKVLGDSQIYNCIVGKKDKDDCYLAGFISTQKITQWFVGAVLYAWLILGTYLACEKICICGWLLNFVLTWTIWIILKFAPMPFGSSCLKGMEDMEK